MTLTLIYMMKTPDVCPFSQSLLSLQAMQTKACTALVSTWVCHEWTFQEHSSSTLYYPHYSFEIFLERNGLHSISHHISFQSFDQRTTVRSRASRGPDTHLASSSPTTPHAELHLQGYTASSYNPYFLPQTNLLIMFNDSVKQSIFPVYLNSPFPRPLDRIRYDSVC